MVTVIILSLSFSNYSDLVEGILNDCWVIVKENYEWVHDDEQIVAISSNQTLHMIRNVDCGENGSKYRFIASLFHLIQ